MDGREEHSLASDLFMELGSEIRCSMLFALNRGPAKLSTLARQLDITVQHAHQNLNRLCDIGLVERGDGTFQITEFGRMVTGQIPYFQFAKKHSTFFKDHTLGGIPEKFVQRIGALQGCRTVNSVTAVLQKLKELESSANKSLKVMAPQAWPEEGEIFLGKVGLGVDIYVLVGHNTIMPKNVMEDIAPRFQKLASMGMINGGMVERLNIGLYIADDSQAAVMFPNAKGEVDMNAMFVGEDPAFCEWCSDYFNHVWEISSKPINPNKMKMVEY
jgi:predicted transcriptional regulator